MNSIQFQFQTPLRLADWEAVIQTGNIFFDMSIVWHSRQSASPTYSHNEYWPMIG